MKSFRNTFLPVGIAIAMLSACTQAPAPQDEQAATPTQQAAAPVETAGETAGFDHLTPLLQAYVDDDKLTGSVVLITRDGETVYARAFGWRDRETEAPMKQDTIFRIASQTKAIVSVAIMILAEEGKLELDAPLGDYLPAWSETTVAVETANGGYDVVPARRPITVRDLLSHSAGISYGWGPAEDAWRDAGVQGWYFANRDEPVASVVARMASLPMDAHPGEKFVYGYSTDILGVLVETLSETALDEFLRKRITSPLGMEDTHFYLPVEKTDRLAVVYELNDGALTRAPDADETSDLFYYGQGHYVNGPKVAFSGGAGMLSTARDYSRFLTMLLNGGELDGQRILSAASVEEMQTDQLPDDMFGPGAGFGLGFAINEDPDISDRPGGAGAYGWGGAYHSRYWIDPAEGLTVVYLTQLLPMGDIDDYETLNAAINAAQD